MRLSAKADYFSKDPTLAKNGLLVDIDISGFRLADHIGKSYSDCLRAVLDPYILNVVPQSLVPTATYIILLAVFSWFLSNWTWSWLNSIAGEESERSKVKRT